MTIWLQKIRYFILTQKTALIFFLISFVIFYCNAFHEQYPDEFDNLLGGWYILHGILPFSGFFSHHGPVAYFVSALIQLFSGHSFVSFRIVYEIFLSASIFLWYLYIQSRFGKIITHFYLYFSVLLAIAATYFWGHMLIADSLSGYFLTFVFALILLLFVYKQKLRLRDIAYISLLTSAALLTSLTYIYLCFIIYIFTLFLFFKQTHKSDRWRRLGIGIGLLALPYFIFLIYLLLTRSLSDYMYQSIVFNQKYYIYNYPGLQNGHINPIRFAIVILHSFLNNYIGLLTQVKNFQFIFPFNVTLAVVDVSLLIYLCIRRQFAACLFVFLYIVYANARSNPLDSKETDYQSSVYIMASLLNLCFLLPALFHEIQLPIHQAKKAVMLGLFLLSSVYAFFTILLLSNSFANKTYDKYMGLAPLIYDHSSYAPVVNAVLSKDDYVWIGPLEFQEYYYTNAKLASKYHILIPGMGHSEKIQQEFLSDLAQTQPKVIVFKATYGILGSTPDKFAPYFTNYLKANYVRLLDYSSNGVHYSSVTPVSDSYDIEANLYINKKNTDTIIASLLNANLIKADYGISK